MMETDKKYSDIYKLNKKLADLSYDIDMAMFKTLRELPGKEFIMKSPNGTKLKKYYLDPEEPGKILEASFMYHDIEGRYAVSVFNHLMVDYKITALLDIEDAIDSMDELKTFDELTD